MILGSMSRSFFLLALAGFSVMTCVESLHLPAQHHSALSTRAFRRASGESMQTARLRHALRGGAGGDDSELADMMDDMVKVSQDAAKNPPLPPLAEAAVQVFICCTIHTVLLMMNALVRARARSLIVQQQFRL